MRAPSTASREPPWPLSWAARLALGALAFGGSALYALSFRAGGTRPDADLAAAVAVAAGVSWLVFGAALLLATRGRPSWLAWADACLATMAWGMAVLLAAALLNLAVSPGPPVHAALLALSNLVMGTVFVLRARRLGMGAPLAAALWLLVLDGAFLALLAFLAVTT